jgi:autophagy-related protein 2
MEAAAVINLQAIHIFLDLSLVERLLPMLRSIAPATQALASRRNRFASLSPMEEKSSGVPGVLIDQYVIDDLDLQAATSRATMLEKGAAMLTFRCPMVRLDIRCPAPPDRRGSWEDGAHLRSGIVTLDLHGLIASIGEPPTASRRASPRQHSTHGLGQAPSNGKDTSPIANLEWQKMIFFFCRVSEKRSTAFLIIGPLSPDPVDDVNNLLLPAINLKSSLSPKINTLTCRIPSVQAKINRSTIEGLQFFADDMTHWLDGAFGDDSAPKPRDDLRMIGSRFFGGSKASSSASSSLIDVGDDNRSGGATILQVLITEIDIGLHVPREGEMGGERLLGFRASDVDSKLELNVTGIQETMLSVTIMDSNFSDRSDMTRPQRILGRTTPLALTLHNSPIINLRFTSATYPETSTKESSLKLNISSVTTYITKDYTWLTDLIAFAKSPDGVFEDVVPSEISRVGIVCEDVSVHVEAPTTGGGLVLSIGSGEVKTDVITGADEGIVEIEFGNVGVLAVDDLRSIGEITGAFATTKETWKVSESRHGFHS